MVLSALTATYIIEKYTGLIQIIYQLTSASALMNQALFGI